MRAKRVTIYRDRKKFWRYRVQAFNNRVIESSEEGFVQKRTVLKRVGEKYPNVEIVEG